MPGWKPARKVGKPKLEHAGRGARDIVPSLVIVVTGLQTGSVSECSAGLQPGSSVAQPLLAVCGKPRQKSVQQQNRQTHTSFFKSIVSAISKYAHKALASCMCRGLRHSGSNNFGLPTTITADIAREVATFNRFRLYKNSIPRGASSGEDVVSE